MVSGNISQPHMGQKRERIIQTGFQIKKHDFTCNNRMEKTIRCGKHQLTLERTIIMGVLNVTPDSFSRDGIYADTDQALEHAKRMVKEGADIIDVGGESSRPGSEPISVEQELERVWPVISQLLAEADVPISIDTYKPEVARVCLKMGAHMVNDITGLADRRMMDTVAQYGVPAVIMHMKGSPKSMQQEPKYGDVVNEVKAYLKERADAAKKAGIKDVIIDPGIGFGKTTEHNLQLIKRLAEFKTLGCPVLIGPSRKSFIGDVTGLPVNERLEGTLAAVAVSIMNGANIVRVHDVLQVKRAAQVADAIRGA
ncbi:MAG: dihydropteroate synthase [Candidatus Altiarchaeota archaeon]